MRKEIITQSLNIPFIFTIIKYDYYIEGVIDSILLPDEGLSEQKEDRVVFINLSSKGRVISKDRNGKFKLWDIIKNTVISLNELTDIEYIEFLSDGRIVGFKNGNLQIWNLENLKLENEFSTGIDYVYGIFVIPENRIIVYGTDNDIKICDSYGNIMTLTGHTNSIRCVCIFKNKLVSGSDDNTLRIWNISNGKCESILIGHDGYVNCVETSGDLLISGSSDETIRIWKNNICQKVLQDKYNIGKILIFDDKIVSTWEYFHPGNNFEIKVWNINTGLCENILHHKRYITDMKLLPNGQLISSSLNQLTIWDLSTYEPINIWEANSIICIPSNKKIITQYKNGLRIWK